MRLFSWLHKPMAARPHTGHTPARKPAACCRPQLEVLEGRCLPSTLAVTSPKDHGPGTLTVSGSVFSSNTSYNIYGLYTDGGENSFN